MDQFNLDFDIKLLTSKMWGGDLILTRAGCSEFPFDRRRLLAVRRTLRGKYASRSSNYFSYTATLGNRM